MAEPGLVALVPFLVQDSSVRRKILETQLRYTQQKWAPFSEEVQGVFGALLAPVSHRHTAQGGGLRPGCQNPQGS